MQQHYVLEFPSKEFPLGQLRITTAAAKTLLVADIATAIPRHAIGDWGHASNNDYYVNEHSLNEGGYELTSAFNSERGGEFLIVTEADRSATTILLPSDN